MHVTYAGASREFLIKLVLCVYTHIHIKSCYKISGIIPLNSYIFINIHVIIIVIIKYRLRCEMLIQIVRINQCFMTFVFFTFIYSVDILIGYISCSLLMCVKTGIALGIRFSRRIRVSYTHAHGKLIMIIKCVTFCRVIL